MFDQDGEVMGINSQDIVRCLLRGEECIKNMVGKKTKFTWSWILPRGNGNAEIEKKVNTSIEWANKRIQGKLEKEGWGILNTTGRWFKEQHNLSYLLSDGLHLGKWGVNELGRDLVRGLKGGKL